VKRIAALLALALLSCRTDVGDTYLADVDLTDMKEVERLGILMSPEERYAFATYVIEHNVSSANYCGRPLVSRRGQGPATIQEAIEMTQIRQARDAAADSIEGDTSGSRDQVIRQWDDLISRRDLLMERQILLRAHNASVAEHRSIRAKIADLDSQLLELRPKYLSAGS
jgi:hypothetical protein